MYIAPGCSFSDEYEDVTSPDYGWYFPNRDKTADQFLKEEQYLYVIGEPGFGKSSLLLKKLLGINEEGKEGCYIHLMYLINSGSVRDILAYTKEEYLSFDEVTESILTDEISTNSYKTLGFSGFGNDGLNTWLMLDGLDEIDFKLIPLIVAKVKKIVHQFPNLHILVAGRSYIFDWYSDDLKRLKTFNYLLLHPLNRKAVYSYVDATISDKELVAMIKSYYDDLSLLNIFQVPRYLKLTLKYLQESDDNKGLNITKSTIFCFLLDEKLEIEGKRLAEEVYLGYIAFLKELALGFTLAGKEKITEKEFLSIYTVGFILDRKVLFHKTILKKFHSTHELSFDHKELQEYLTSLAILSENDPVDYISRSALDLVTGDIHPNRFNVLSFVIEENSHVYFFVLNLTKDKLLQGYVSDRNIHLLLNVAPNIIEEKYKVELLNIFLTYYVGLNLTLRREWISKLTQFCDINTYQLIEVKITEYLTKLKTNSTGLFNLFFLLKSLILENLVTTVQCISLVKLIKRYWGDTDLRSNIKVVFIDILGILCDIDAIQVLYDKDLFTIKRMGGTNTFTSGGMERDCDFGESFAMATNKIDPEGEFSIQVSIDVIIHNEGIPAYTTIPNILGLKTEKGILFFLTLVRQSEVFWTNFLSRGYRPTQDINMLHILFDNYFDSLELILIENLTTIYSSYKTGRQVSKESYMVKGMVHLFQGRSIKIVDTITDKMTKNNGRYRQLVELLAEISNKANVVDIYKLIKINALGMQGQYLHSIFELNADLYASHIVLCKEIDEIDKVKLLRNLPEAISDNDHNILQDFDALSSVISKDNFLKVIYSYNNHDVLDKSLTNDQIDSLVMHIHDCVFQCSVYDFDQEKDGKQSPLFNDLLSKYIVIFQCLGTQNNLTIALLENTLSPDERINVVSLIPFIDVDSYLHSINELVPNLDSEEIVFLEYILGIVPSDLMKESLGIVVNFLSQYRISNDMIDLLLPYLFDDAIDSHVKVELLDVIDDNIITNDVFLKALKILFSDCKVEEVQLKANDLLLKFSPQGDLIDWRVDYLKSLAQKRPKKFSLNTFAPTGNSLNNIESEHLAFTLPKYLLLLTDEYSSYFKELLTRTLEFDLTHDFDFDEYVVYLYDVCFRYFENIVGKIGYTFILEIEKTVRFYNQKGGLNWFLYTRITSLKKKYSSSFSLLLNNQSEQNLINTPLTENRELSFFDVFTIMVTGGDQIISFKMVCKDQDFSITLNNNKSQFNELKNLYNEYNQRYPFKQKEFSPGVVLGVLFACLSQNEGEQLSNEYKFELSPSNIATYRDKIRPFSGNQKPVTKSQSTINKYVSRINGFFHVLKREGIVDWQIKMKSLPGLSGNYLLILSR